MLIYLQNSEHWNVASNHGRSVASSIMGKKEPYSKTAIFWSAQGAQLRYVGNSHSSQFETVYIDGNADEKKVGSTSFKIARMLYADLSFFDVRSVCGILW